MSSARDVLVEAANAVTIHSPWAYSWFGQRVDDLPEDIGRAMSAETARNYLTHRLQDELYRNLYCRGFAAPRAELDAPVTHAAASFVSLLSAANCGRGPREPGWVVVEIDGETIVVERDGLRLWVHRRDVSVDGEAPVVGAATRVRFPKELRKLSPGFYMALGDVALAERGDPIVRFYWNLTGAGAPRFVEQGTRLLNGAGLAFRLKVVEDPGRFSRCDAGVLYVRKADYAEAVGHVAAVHRALARECKPATPPFTKRLAVGLALAEEPGSEDSFGMDRCRLVAEGLVAAEEAGARATEERVEVMANRFEQAGVSVETPFLNSGSEDDYWFPGDGAGPVGVAP